MYAMCYTKIRAKMDAPTSTSTPSSDNNNDAGAPAAVASVIGSVSTRSSSRRKNIRGSSPTQKYKDYVCDDTDTDDDVDGDYVPPSSSSKISTNAHPSNGSSRSNASVSNKSNGTRKVQANGVVEPFPIKLHNMLRGTAMDGLDHIVSWQPHGRCFIVHQPQKFVTEVMPTYFKQSKFPSFQRQLNLYGFQRITKGLDKNGYHHPKFLRGQPELTDTMTRMKVKGTGVRGKTRPEDEPNFYRMPPIEEYDFAQRHKADTSDTCADIASNELITLNNAIAPSPLAAAPTMIRPPIRGQRLSITLQHTQAPLSFDVQKNANAGNHVVTPPITPQSSPADRQLHLMDALDCAILTFVGSQGLPEEEGMSTQQQLLQQMPPPPLASSADFYGDNDISQHKAWPGLPSSPIKVQDAAPTACTSTDTTGLADDVLFFEGRPFHYLASME